MNPKIFVTAVFAGSVFLAGLSGCQKNEEVNGKGPAEQAGQKIDQAAEKAGQEINKAADRTGQEINKAVEKTGQQIEKVGEKIQEKAKEVQK